MPGEAPAGHPVDCTCGQYNECQASTTGYRLVLEIEVPGFYVDGSTQKTAEEFNCQIVDIVTEEWMRKDVGLTLVSLPGEKCMNSDFEVHAMNGRIVGARIVEIDPDDGYIHGSVA